MSIDIQKIRSEFPILERTVHGKPLVYLDNGATTHKPVVVLDTLERVYRELNSNIHRGVHYLSNQCTDAYESARAKLTSFINAEKSSEVILTSGATESINLLANSFSDTFLKEGDEIIISEMEHHSNIVPWQLLAMKKGVVIKPIAITDEGELDLNSFKSLLSERTKLVSVTYISNVLGTVNPVSIIIEEAHKFNVPVMIDGAQAVQHLKIDVQKLDCDFLVFSGHKMYGPTGTGVLYGKEKWLEQMKPYKGGGEMIQTVSFKKPTTFNELPFKFEAGTPNYAGAIALGAAADYITSIGIENIASYEEELLKYAEQSLKEIVDLRIFGTSKNKSSVISFLVGKIHPFDMGMFLDKMGIAIRTGHHCAQPLMERFEIPGTVRASFAIYNTKEEIDVFVDGLKKVCTIFA